MTINWEGAVENFTKSFAKRNIHKIKQVGYEEGDLINDSYIVFARCRDSFRGANIAQFIAMYRKSLNNYVIDLIRTVKIENMDKESYYEESD